MTRGFDYWLCGSCGTPTQVFGDACQVCGVPDALVAVRDGFLAQFPASSIPCPSCGSSDRPLVFRGWVRLRAFLYWARESRASAYLCEPCARAETAKALLFSALLGWWSFPSALFYGWRGLYLNWRSIWAPPRNPHAWGAIGASEFAADAREAREQALSDADEDWLRTETPLGALNDVQIGLVLAADDLYGLFGIDAGADVGVIHRAYRSRCKESHPDLHDSTPRESTEAMIRLNEAWEILRSPEMRRAYDWLEQQRNEEPVA